MASHYHVVVWIDHKQARIFHFNADEADKIVIHPERPIQDDRRNRQNDTYRDPVDKRYLEQVAEAVADAGALLIVGPANEKHELMRHIEDKHPNLKAKVEGVEAADHPSDGELLAHARRTMAAADRMRPA